MRAPTRRELIAGATAGAFTAAVDPAWGSLLSRRAAVGPGRFRDGVATGDPTPTAVTFWSRLRTERLRSGARLIVARDEGMRRVVATAVVPTGRGVDHTLKARVGGLEPATEYFYVWETTNGVSPVGRTRTRLPKDSAEPLRIAFSSCQQFQSGYFTPHTHAAAEDLDLYLFLGDYIYERGRARLPTDVRDDASNAVDLGSYRFKYLLARSDAGLQELHRLHPALHVLDDHEVENNYSDNLPTPSALQRSAGYRAASEWIPRVVNKRDRYRIFRRVPLNANAELFLLDTRQYRTGSNDGLPPRILGDAQMAWLLAALKSSTAQWKIIVQQVAVGARPFGPGLGPRQLGRLPRGPGAAPGRDRAQRHPERRLPHRRRPRVLLQRARERLRGARRGHGAAVGGGVHRRIGDLAGPRPARRRRSAPRRPGTASTTAPSAATPCSPSTRPTS